MPTPKSNDFGVFLFFDLNNLSRNAYKALILQRIEHDIIRKSNNKGLLLENRYFIPRRPSGEAYC
jgi:ATP-dependent helicase/DNAse subunit B